jgi:hypothetical protein
MPARYPDCVDYNSSARPCGWQPPNSPRDDGGMSTETEDEADESSPTSLAHEGPVTPHRPAPAPVQWARNAPAVAQHERTLSCTAPHIRTGRRCTY